MSIKGFIIAIEKYNGFLPDLKGVEADAAAFCDWLVNVKGVLPTDLYICAADTFSGRTTGTTRQEIVDELRRFKQTAVDTTEEFYFYFSGHGYSSPTASGQDTDVLVAADFQSLDDGDACISLDEIKAKLYSGLGPGHHFYFIDACRNSLEDVEYATTGIKTTRSALGTPSIYRVFSTAQGQTAKVNSQFGAVLLDGLNGKGIAKELRRNEMWIVFDRLCEYVKKRIKTQSIFHHIEGNGEGLIWKIVPFPRINCRFVIENADDDDPFSLEYGNIYRPSERIDFKGREYEIKNLVPGDYDVSLTSEFGRVTARDAEFAQQPFSLFDSGEIVFSFAKTAFPATGELIKPDLENAFENDGEDTPTLGDGDVQPEIDSFKEKIKQFTPLEILKNLSSKADFDAPLWLSLIGASQIVLGAGHFEKLAKLGLPDFAQARPHEAQIFVLGRLHKSAEEYRFGIGYAPDWQMPETTEIEEIKFSVTAQRPGSHLLSIKRPDLPTFTYSVCCLPNRVTLFVIDEDETRNLTVRQFILPVRHLFGYLDHKVLTHLKFDPLKVIKAVAVAQQVFADKQRLSENEFSEEAMWNLTNEKWLDPIMSLFGAFELLRRGQNPDNKAELKKMIENLRRYFPEIPDTEALARLIGEQWQLPAGPPILFEGILAFEIEEENYFGPPARKLDYANLWTRWFGVVE